MNTGRVCAGVIAFFFAAVGFDCLAQPIGWARLNSQSAPQADLNPPSINADIPPSVGRPDSEAHNGLKQTQMLLSLPLLIAQATASPSDSDVLSQNIGQAAVLSPVPNAEDNTRVGDPLSTPTSIEATLFSGHTQFNNGPGNNKTSKNGVRFAELAYAPSPDIRVWVQYDNGLSLDNADLARQGIKSPTYYLGGLVHYLGKHTTRLEIGHRTLPDSINQVILRGEQVLFLPGNYTLKAGAWIGHRNDSRTERIFNAGFGIPVTPAFRVEPSVFYSRSGVPGEKQWRGLLAGEYSFEAGYRIGGGFSVGRATTVTGNRTVRDIFMTASAPLGNRHRAHFFLRHEDLSLGRKTAIVGLGVTLAF